MNSVRPEIRCAICILFALVASASQLSHADESVRSLIEQKCLRCHGGEDINGEVDVREIVSSRQRLQNPELIAKIIGAIDGNNMPPEDEPQLNDQQRAQLLSSLKSMLRNASDAHSKTRVPIRRLNRFQYNYAVRDLFQLRRNLFALPEKLMTRHSNYLAKAAGKLPRQVNASSDSLAPQPGLSAVKAFPKDLRATHGFDNQANELTLSPLLLDAFLQLSVSIVESSDFNEQNVGIWSDFFAPHGKEAETKVELERRLRPFLTLAFRSPVDNETLNRYVAYVKKKIAGGMPFTDSMKKVASAALSSPRFLYRIPTTDSNDADFELASKLSFFLWSSGPDAELLQLAARGELSKPEVLNRTVDRMLASPKIERFLDTFPVQWMQLENVLAATPDPALNRYFRLDNNRPAGLQMVLEPLLLFDAVFVEDRPITELIKPEFSYRSEFLNTWYTSDLKPEPVDTDSIVEQNRRNDTQRENLQTAIADHRRELSALRTPVKQRILATRKQESGDQKPVDLMPYAAWEFNGDLKESIRSLKTRAKGQRKIEFEDGMVVLNKSFLQTDNLPFDLRAKSLEVWCKVDNLDQPGGGVMGIQGPGDFFDTIVIGERKPRHWISGSNGFSRTEDFPESTPETKAGEMLHLVMVYAEDGTTTMYRDGQPYGKPFRKGQATFPRDRTSVIFGLRHLPAGGNKYLDVKIDKARLYTRALTAEEIAASAAGGSYVSAKEMLAAMTPEEREHVEKLANAIAKFETELAAVPPNEDPGKARQVAQNRFEEGLRRQMRARKFRRVAVDDPRYGGVITNAAVMSMTSGPKRTHPIARGAWITEVILNDPPAPPPNDVPPLNEDSGDQNQTIRERFAAHRENPSCAGCHSRLDPLGFALENFDLTGRWRDKYPNGRNVDMSGTLLRKYKFDSVEQFKESLCKEDQRFAKAFTRHLLRFATSRELVPADTLAVDAIIENAGQNEFRLKSLIREIVRSESFLGARSR